MEEPKTNEMKLYKSFDTAEIASLLTDLLAENSIPFEVYGPEGKIEDFDREGSYSSLEINVLESDFDKVDKLIEDRADQELETVAKDYFIFEFSNDELKEVLIHADEWSALDLALAHKLLKDRGEPMDKDQLEIWRAERIAKSAEPQDASQGWVVISYVLAFILPLISLITGLVYMRAKKIDLNDNAVPKYSAETKKHGKMLFTISLFMMIIYTILNFTI